MRVANVCRNEWKVIPLARLRLALVRSSRRAEG